MLEAAIPLALDAMEAVYFLSGAAVPSDEDGNVIDLRNHGERFS